MPGEHVNSSVFPIWSRKAGIYAFAAVAVAGLLGTGILVVGESNRLKENGTAEVSILDQMVSSEVNDIERGVRVMAGSPWIAPAIISGTKEDLDKANSVLDRYNFGMGESASYLMDTEGRAIASSNRDTPESFVGQSYEFRPYFKEAVSGRPFLYFACGIKSGKEGVYASYPVKDENGKVIGVVAMKKNIDQLKNKLARRGIFYLISPEGVIFLSNEKMSTAKSIVPLGEAEQKKLLESRQFGDIPFEPVFREMPASGSIVVHRDGIFMVVLKKTRWEGWSVLVLEPMKEVFAYGAIGVITTLFFLIGIGGYLSYLNFSEKALVRIKENEDKFKILSDSTNEGVVVHEDGTILEANDRFAEILGYPLSEMAGANIFDYIDPEDREDVRNRIKSGSDVSYELVMRRKDASPILVEACGRAMSYKGRTVRVTSVRDISSYKEMQNILERVAQEWVTTFNSIPDLLSIHDKNFRIIRANKAFADFFGMKMEEVIGKYCYEIVDKTHQPLKACPLGLSLKTRTKQTAEFFEPKKGVYFEVTTAPLYDESGEVLSVVHVAKDVTAQKQMEITLRESEQATRKSYSQITQIFQSVGDGVCVIDVDGNILQMNKAFAAMLGVAGSGEAIGKKHTEVLPSLLRQAYHEAIKEFEKGEERVEADVLLDRQDGINIPCIMTVTPFYDVKDRIVGVILSLKDITERKSAEKALLESVKMKNNFMSMVSHELRTPLTAIKEGISIVLDGSAGEINEEQRDFLDTAYRNVDRLTRIVNDVLDLSKLKSGKMAMKIEESDMSQAVLEVAKSNEALASSKGLYLKVDIDPGVPHARFDRDRIAQVLSNLVSNAMKFTESGGVTISVKSKEDGIFVSVSDTGPGVKPDDIQKLFTEFRQLEDARTRKTGGTGLGLAICRQIVERHGGRIWAESEYGKGSAFNFVIPFERMVKVLIVDDDMYFQELAGRLLYGKGYTVLRAVTGLEGVELAAKNKPDIIVLDMRLPDMNGYEVVGRIRSEEELSDTPILAVSGYKEEFKKLEKVQGSALERLSKPFENEEFLFKVRSLVKAER